MPAQNALGTEIGSICQMSTEPSHSKILARFQIINQIEKDWNLIGHRDIRKIKCEAFKTSRLLPLKTHFLEVWIFYVYLFMALI